MKSPHSPTRRRSFALVAGLLAATASLTIVINEAQAQRRPVVARQGAPAARADRPARTVNLGLGGGELVTLPSVVADIFIADEKIADVQVRSGRQIYVYGKAEGETTLFAVGTNGKVIYAANIRVGRNVNSIEDMLKLAMPEAHIKATPMNGVILLTGTVANADDAVEAAQLVEALTGANQKIVNRLKLTMPLQVSLQVKIAEVSRDLVKEIGVNLNARDTTGGFQFGYHQGRDFVTIGQESTEALQKLDASALFGLPSGSISLPFDPKLGKFVYEGKTIADFAKLALDGKSTIGMLGKIFGVDVAAAIDLAERDGMLTMLAQPTLTALSGETATFLAGGEIPIPVAQALGAVSIEYKQYGVSLAFTPTVLEDGRISIRVRPEVSELSNAGAIRFNGFSVPALVTRRTETTVELGSGQSFMIAGLMRNNVQNNFEKTPGLSDLPVLGSMFRANTYRRDQTEVMVVVTPYLVKPTDASKIILPTDAYQAPTDLQRVLNGQVADGVSGAKRPQPTIAPSVSTPEAPPPDRARKGGSRQPAPAPASPGFSR